VDKESNKFVDRLGIYLYNKTMLSYFNANTMKKNIYYANSSTFLKLFIQSNKSIIITMVDTSIKYIVLYT